MQSAECGDYSAECGVQSAECRVQSAECRVQSAECRVQSRQIRGFLKPTATLTALKAPELAAPKKEEAKFSFIYLSFLMKSDER